jgi:hypothetical protein
MYLSAKLFIVLLAMSLVFSMTALSFSPSRAAEGDESPQGSIPHEPHVWDFSNPDEYTTFQTTIGPDGVRLDTQNFTTVHEMPEMAAEGYFTNSTAGLHQGNVSLSMPNPVYSKEHNLTDAWLGTFNETGRLRDADSNNVGLNEDEYVDVFDFESYTYPNALLSVRMSITMTFNNGLAALAVRLNTGSGWTSDLNTSQAGVEDSTYWISLDYHGIDNASEFNSLQARVYCRDPAADPGTATIWIDQIQFHTNYSVPLYSSVGDYVSPIIDGQYESVWTGISWSGSSTGPGT